MVAGVEEVLKEFAESVEELLKMPLSEFISKYRDLLPKYSIIHYHANVGTVFSHLKDEREVMVVVDSEGNVRGILTPTDIVSILRPGGRGVIRMHFGVAYAVGVKKLPPKSLVKLDVVSVMDKHPLVLEDDMSLSVAIERLSMEKTQYAVVVNAKGKILGVISTTSIVKAIAKLSKSIFELAEHKV